MCVIECMCSLIVSERPLGEAETAVKFYILVYLCARVHVCICVCIYVCMWMYECIG